MLLKGRGFEWTFSWHALFFSTFVLQRIVRYTVFSRRYPTLTTSSFSTFPCSEVSIDSLQYLSMLYKFFALSKLSSRRCPPLSGHLSLWRAHHFLDVLRFLHPLNFLDTLCTISTFSFSSVFPAPADSNFSTLHLDKIRTKNEDLSAQHFMTSTFSCNDQILLAAKCRCDRRSLHLNIFPISSLLYI